MRKENVVGSFGDREETFPKADNRRKVLLRLLKGFSILMQSALFVAVWVTCYVTEMEDPYLWRGDVLVAVLYGAALLLFVRIYGGFRVGDMERSEIFLSHAISQFITNVLFFALSFLLCGHIVSPLPLLGLQTAEMLLMYLWVLLAELVDRKFDKKRRLAILYRSEENILRVSHIDSFLRHFTVFEKLQLAPGEEVPLDRLLASGAEAVLLVGVEATTRNDIVKECTKENVPVYILPKISDILLHGVETELFSGEILFHSRQASVTPEYAFLKRTFDIVASFCALVIVSPIIFVTALAIRLEDGGPVFYRQIRLTKNGQRFRIIKFRSMHVDAEKDGTARLSTVGDDRITKVGRFIRACRIDELPQLINILRGEMTIVGPRPERPEIAEQYEKNLPEFALRLQVKAGLTGYAQIYGRYNSEPYEKLLMDLMYINRMSVVEDLRLMLGTVRTLFSKESTEGVEQGQTTAVH